MHTQRQDYQTVFVVRDIKKQGIIEDDIIEVEAGKFKSIKFRHTYYETGDFLLSEQEVIEFYKTRKTKP